MCVKACNSHYCYGMYSSYNTFVCADLKFTVKYKVEIPSGIAPSPPPIDVSFPADSTAQRVMEIAANMSNQYQFTVTYYGSFKEYYVDKLSGVANDTTSSYFWKYYFKPPHGVMFEPQIGINEFIIPEGNGELIFRYQHIPSPKEHGQLKHLKAMYSS